MPKAPQGEGRSGERALQGERSSDDQPPEAVERPLRESLTRLLGVMSVTGSHTTESCALGRREKNLLMACEYPDWSIHTLRGMWDSADREAFMEHLRTG